ncbi:MAG: DUF2793 domain-containing protein [Pseudomonadota bacterium]
MAESFRLGLPFLESGQAQKHVTVNEGLERIDALAGGTVESLGADTAPASPADGSAHVVGAAPTGDWAGRADAVAIRSNGAWVFVTPWAGLSLADAATGERAVFDGNAWVSGRVAGSASGAATVMRVLETELTLSGASTDTAPLIRANDVVLGATARVLDAVSGATAWRLGVAGAEDRYGSGLGIAAGSYALGVSGTPTAYYADTVLRVSAEGGSFSAGRIRLAVHIMTVLPPVA